MPTHHKSIIKVIGVGGGGSNAVNHMYNLGIKDVEFVVCNTDSQALKTSPVPNRLQIGVNLTSGLGAGANPGVGRDAALESKEDIREMLNQDTRMVFVTAGMGGGTGTGAAPVLAQVAKEMNILTVGIVTMPFSFEGRKKMKQAEEGLAELKASCDTVLVILNDKLREIYGNLTISSAFARADNILTTAAKGIAEIITVPGYVNVDFEDVKTVMVNSGAAVMGAATTEGENRALRAAEEALASPLLNNQDILGADKILLSIISGEQAELSMDELAEITDYIQEQAGDSAEVIFGHGIDTELEDSIRVTVIATGFENARDEAGEEIDEIEAYRRKLMADRKVIDLETNRQIDLFEAERAARKESAASQSAASEQKSESKGYSFEGTSSREEAAPEQEPEVEKTYFDLGEEFEFITYSKEEEEEEEVPPVIESPVNGANAKRDELARQAEERKNRLKGLNRNAFNNEDEIKEKLEVPAYLRKNVKLKDVPHSSESDISRFNLNDDNQILGNNKFLHDNVD